MKEKTKTITGHDVEAWRVISSGGFTEAHRIELTRLQQSSVVQHCNSFALKFFVAH